MPLQDRPCDVLRDVLRDVPPGAPHTALSQGFTDGPVVRGQVKLPNADKPGVER